MTALKKLEEQTKKEEDQSTPFLTDSRYCANFNYIVQMILVVDVAGFVEVSCKYQLHQYSSGPLHPELSLGHTVV